MAMVAGDGLCHGACHDPIVIGKFEACGFMLPKIFVRKLPSAKMRWQDVPAEVLAISELRW